MPVLLAWQDPDHVPRPDLLDRPAPTLHPADTKGNDQGLAQRMGVPGSARPRLERDARAPDASRIIAALASAFLVG
jgi:hypothetical protein